MPHLQVSDQALTCIEVWADVGCPFTHVGLRRFVGRRAELGRDDVRLHVRAWPLEIVNGTPLDAAFIAEEIDELRRQVTPDSFSGFDEDVFPSSSLPAMTLAAIAYEHDLEVGERVSLELRDLLFEQGVAIGSSEVLGELAERHGLEIRPDTLDDPARVFADRAAGLRRGVVGSPHFFTPGGGFFCPALDIRKDNDGHLRIEADPEGFDAFIATCFA